MSERLSEQTMRKVTSEAKLEFDQMITEATSVPDLIEVSIESHAPFSKLSEWIAHINESTEKRFAEQEAVLVEQTEKLRSEMKETEEFQLVLA